MKPQDYSARTDCRPPAGWYRRLNWLGVGLTSLGLSRRDAVTLQVRGRSSGKSRRVAILRTHCQGEDYLVALAGESQWVTNVRAASGEAVIRRRGARHVCLEEVAPADRPDIIAEYLHAGRQRSGAEANANQARFYSPYADGGGTRDEAVHIPLAAAVESAYAEVQTTLGWRYWSPSRLRARIYDPGRSQIAVMSPVEGVP